MEETLELKSLSEEGDTYFKERNANNAQNITFGISSHNAEFKSNLTIPGTKRNMNDYIKRDGSTEGKDIQDDAKYNVNPNKLRNRENRNNWKALETELSSILLNSKKLMFAIQLMKHGKCAEVFCKKDNEKYEILSMTRPRVNTGPLKQEIITLEMMVTQTYISLHLVKGPSIKYSFPK